MTIGTLRHRITLQRPLIANDAYGVPVTTWIDAATVWASSAMYPRLSPPRDVAERAEAVTIYFFDIRYRTDVMNNWRVIWNGRTLTVNTAGDLDGAKKYIRIAAEERQ